MTARRRVVQGLRSVRGRITLISTALVAATLMLASLLLVNLVRADLLDGAERALSEALDAQAQQFGIAPEALPSTFEFVSPDGEIIGLSLFSPYLDGPEEAAFGEVFVDGEFAAFLVIDADTGEMLEVIDPATEESIDGSELAIELESFLFDVTTVGDDGVNFVVGATPLDEIEESVEAIEGVLLFLVPALVMTFALLIWLLLGRALQPVVSITEQVELISTSNLDRRVPVPDTDDEVANLATVMNRMLNRLERGDQRQRQFSADASHELRSPLSTVRAAGEILGRSPTPERTIELADDIVAEADRMDHLIGDLLALSRLDETSIGDDRRTIDLALLVRAELDGDEVELLADGDVTIEAAADPVRRVIRNLVDNAKRHAESRVVVTVTGEDGQALLIVEDDGPGVPAGREQEIFERFSRLDTARDRSAGGFGLGLALVASIVDAHGGTVAVDRAELGGARFTVTLPR